MNVRKFILKILRMNYYKDINANIEILKNHIHEPKEINSERLNEFLNFTIENSKYYKELNKKKLNEFPILTKKILKNHFDGITTVKQQNKNDFVNITTSGSTGTPFQFKITKDKQNNKQSQILYFGSFSKFDIGIKHAFIRSTNPSLAKIITKNQYVIPPDNIGPEWIKNSINLIQKKKIKVIVGYPSVINNMATIMNKESIKISSVEGIITSGENLTEEMKSNIYSAFNLLPFSRYATEELGVIANEYGDGSGFLVNQVDFLVEVLDDSLNPVNEGKSGRVVVTDFKSHITPLIRYDTGDIATVKKYKNGLVYEIDRLEGRKIETIFDVFDNPVSAFSINTIMRTYSDILQFQFVQHSKNEYELKVLPIDIHDYEIYGGAISKLEKLLGDSSYIRLSVVSEIQPLGSGKRPYIINNYVKE